MISPRIAVRHHAPTRQVHLTLRNRHLQKEVDQVRGHKTSVTHTLTAQYLKPIKRSTPLWDILCGDDDQSPERRSSSRANKASVVNSAEQTQYNIDEPVHIRRLLQKVRVPCILCSRAIMGHVVFNRIPVRQHAPNRFNTWCQQDKCSELCETDALRKHLDTP